MAAALPAISYSLPPASDPNAELAAEAGLTVDNGIVVNGELLTSDPAVSALGDCASFPLPDGSRVRLESVRQPLTTPATSPGGS